MSLDKEPMAKFFITFFSSSVSLDLFVSSSSFSSMTSVKCCYSSVHRSIDHLDSHMSMLLDSITTCLMSLQMFSAFMSDYLTSTHVIIDSEIQCKSSILMMLIKIAN